MVFKVLCDFLPRLFSCGFHSSQHDRIPLLLQCFINQLNKCVSPLNGQTEWAHNKVLQMSLTLQVKAIHGVKSGFNLTRTGSGSRKTSWLFAICEMCRYNLSYLSVTNISGVLWLHMGDL